MVQVKQWCVHRPIIRLGLRPKPDPMCNKQKCVSEAMMKMKKRLCKKDQQQCVFSFGITFQIVFTSSHHQSNCSTSKHEEMIKTRFSNESKHNNVFFVTPSLSFTFIDCVSSLHNNASLVRIVHQSMMLFMVRVHQPSSQFNDSSLITRNQ